jgi:hypothetical protein
VFDCCGDYDGEIGYCEGHAVFDECGNDDGDAAAGDDVHRVHEGHDGRHDWQNEGVSALAEKNKTKRRDELDVEKMKKSVLRRRFSLMVRISRRGR